MKNHHKQSSGKAPRHLLTPTLRYRLQEGLFLLLMGVAVFLLIALLTFHANDPGWSSTGWGKRVFNLGGRVGAWLADVLLSLFGLAAYSLPGWLVWFNWRSMQSMEEANRYFREGLLKTLGLVCLLVSTSSLASLFFSWRTSLPAGLGGIVGDVASQAVLKFLNMGGSILFFITLLLFGVTLLTGLSWLGVMEYMGACLPRCYVYCLKRWHNVVRATPASAKKCEPVFIAPSAALPASNNTIKPPPPIIKKPSSENLPLPQEKTKLRPEPLVQLAPGMLPPLSLLNTPPTAADKPFTSISFEALSQLVEQRLADFGVEVKVVAVLPGPIITRFELDLAPGIKVSKIVGLAKDIARSLSTVSVRIVEVIPGKSVIGLEIPNENRELVTLRDLLESQRYSQSRSPVSLVLGKDIAGHPVIADLSKMPHLLVAGTTGSGKSVGLNAMLLSMLYKATPEQLRFILIDPKMLELSIYDGIPHLLTPVIVDMKDAANALRWCVAEMERRYRLMAALGVRNIAGYNQKVTEALKQGQPLLKPGQLLLEETQKPAYLEPLPLIVVIADELADMMMVVGKKVEDLIARIAQKARAAGIHLIIATQRPSVDVITGLIKANIPTRIAFQVSSRIDSRTILDQQGAEQLLGHGDMLYLPPGAGVPMRVHGAYVADEEVHRVVAAWRSYGEPEYSEDITAEKTGEGSGGEEGEGGSGELDPLYDEAVRIITEGRRASISLVQRRLRIGYNRAARMMEEMEAAGVVSAMDQSGSRDVLAGEPPRD